ncbi:MAG: hypothetical protein SFW07_05570 [Gammaproteobacteria bacterium]|nr:hypothetical protein [Gammaproteobacteria bacterium]
MSIRHVKSTLSERLEDILAKKLLDDAQCEDYQNNRTNDRATIRGKKHDRVALLLREKLISKANISELGRKLNILVDILDSVDDLERGFFSYKSETGKAQMNGAMELASNAYDKIIANGRDLNSSDVAQLTQDLILPKGATKAVQKLVPDPSVNPLL